MICIDVGSARYGGDYSIEWLIEEFHPEIIYAFDPAWQADMYQPADDADTFVIASNEAVWTHDGHVRFTINGLGGHVSTTGPLTPCIDLARFIREVASSEIVLKIDAEGSEYDLLDHLIATETDRLLKMVWVEWHPFGAPDWPKRRAQIEKHLAVSCELEEWRH